MEKIINLKINHLEKNKIVADSVRENCKEFIRSNRLMLNSQQRFRSKKYNLSTYKVIKIALSTNNDKTIQSIDSIETCAYRKNKELIHKKRNKCINTIKHHKKWQTMMTLQKKTLRT